MKMLLPNNFMKKLNIDLYIKGEWKTGKVAVHVSDHLSLLPVTPVKSLKVVNHSPTGFAWGYAGSGPAQLALAILMIFLSKEDALARHQVFKFDVIAKLPQTDFELSFKTIERWIADHE